MTESVATTIGARLKKARGTHTQKSFAKVLDIALTTYQNYERDERQPTIDVIERLMSLGHNVNWILTGKGPEKVDYEALQMDPKPLRVAELNETYQKNSAGSQSLRLDTLKIAITLAQEALDGKTLEPEDYAELVSLIYEALANGLKSAQVLAFAKPAARGLGAIDGRESVDQTNKDAAGKS